jgi:hypothetical protein
MLDFESLPSGRPVPAVDASDMNRVGKLFHDLVAKSMNGAGRRDSNPLIPMLH